MHRWPLSLTDFFVVAVQIPAGSSAAYMGESKISKFQNPQAGNFVSLTVESLPGSLSPTPKFHIFASMKILMVCLGNICRSPLAEGILQYHVKQRGLNWIVDSAGTNGYHVGEAPHRLSQKVALMNGIDISHQRCRKFSKNDLLQYDKIYAMAQEVIEEMEWIAGKNNLGGKVDLLMNELFPGKNIDVPDPWYGPEPGYHEVYRMIDQACEQIILKYSGNSPRTLSQPLSR